MELIGRRALVTGASRGIGEAIARHLSAKGVHVSLVARSAGPLADLASELQGRAYPADLTDAADVAALVPRVEEDGGPIDILVNNAGLDVTGCFDTTPAAELHAVLAVNLEAPVQLCRAVLPGMIERGRGHIVNVSSLASTVAMPGTTIYSASKAGLTHFTAALRTELKGTGVRTTVVELGPIPSDMLDHVKSYGPTAKAFRRLYRTQLAVDIDRTVVAREVVEAIAGGKPYVLIPRRALPFALAVRFPRRFLDGLLVGLPKREA